MAIGIYALYWEKSDLIYIGQTQNTSKRFNEHLNKLNRGTHTNYKVQGAFNMYGKPQFIILEECSIEQLNALEIFYTTEFNSLNSSNGLNIVEAGTVGWGTNSSGSKFTKSQILEVFRMLYSSKTPTYTEIWAKTAVPVGTIKDIRRERSHLWLKSKFPNSYRKMLSICRAYQSKFTSKYAESNLVIKSPEGVLLRVSNIREFCKQYGLSNTNLGEVLRGRRHSHKGWKLP